MAEKKRQDIYVIDTNILIDYPDIIQDGDHRPDKPTIDLSSAHLVIPTIVIQELSKFKNEKSDRGWTARAVSRRIRDLTQGHDTNMLDSYTMSAPVRVGDSEQLLSVLPLHRDFCKNLPFCPRSDDMDGQIIVTAMAASLAARGSRVAGDMEQKIISTRSFNDITLLTNDNGLAIRAREYGVKTSRYGYQYPEPYTGRRDITVPYDLLYGHFIALGYIELEDWQKYMPDQPKLIANEFLVMSASADSTPSRTSDYPYGLDFSHIGRYDSKSQRIVPLKYIRSCPVTPKNAGQAIYAEALMDPEIDAVICTGPAGSGKTYMPTIYGYDACKKGQFIDVAVVPCKSGSTLGALPGDLDEKMNLDVQPLKNALRNYILSEDPDFCKELANLKKHGISPEREGSKRSLKTRLDDNVQMVWENWFHSIPVENARGRDFAYALAIYDEFQDQNASQADTLIKRIGEEGKIVIAGDVAQIHTPYLDATNNGLVYASQLMLDDPRVAQVYITEDEVVRHPLVKEIARRQKRR